MKRHALISSTCVLTLLLAGCSLQPDESRHFSRLEASSGGATGSGGSANGGQTSMCPTWLNYDPSGVCGPPCEVEENSYRSSSGADRLFDAICYEQSNGLALNSINSGNPDILLKEGIPASSSVFEVPDKANVKVGEVPEFLGKRGKIYAKVTHSGSSTSVSATFCDLYLEAQDSSGVGFRASGNVTCEP